MSTLSVYDHDETHARGGWVGMMTSGVAGVKIDDLLVEEVVDVRAYPPRLYSGDASTITVESFGAVTDVALTGPDGTEYALRATDEIAGDTSAVIQFPARSMDCRWRLDRGYVLTARDGTAGERADRGARGASDRASRLSDTHIRPLTEPDLPRRADVA